MRLVYSMAAGLLGLTLSGAAHANTPRLVTHAGRFPATIAQTRGQRATAEELGTAARAILAARDPKLSARTLGGPEVLSFRDGERIVRVPQLHRGLPVVSGGASVVFGADDVARRISHRITEDLPTEITPAIDAATAAEAASRATGLPVDPARATLAIWPAKEGAKLAWLASPAPTPGVAFAPVVVVDAMTGDVVIRFNTAMTAKANVYPSNPVKSPALSVVDLPLESGATTLENELIRALDCVDNQTVKDVEGTPIHLCDLLPKAAPDGEGNFLFSPAGDTAPEDAFAEVQLFHHANVAYERFRSFSPGLFVQEGPLPVIANLRLPQGYPVDAEKMADPHLPLAPFQNAFYAPADPSAELLFGIGEGAMWFGQGPTRDISVDGDVVYHELTHAVIAATIRLVNHPRLDAFGASYAPGAMNEALADYFSSTITGDPDFGEYAAADLAPGFPWIRSLEKPDACPTAIAGEPHQDATLFSGALWSVRASLSVSQAVALDLAIFKAMAGAPSGDLAYEELGELIRAEVAASMGEEVAGAIADAFTARGVFPRCNRVLEYQGKPLLGPEDFFSAWFAPGTQSVGIEGHAPGVVQVHAALPAGTERARITFTRIHLVGGFSSGTPFAPTLLVKFGADPITFGESPYAPLGEVRVIDPERNGDRHSATIEVPPGIKELYLMIGNAGEADGAYTSIAIEPLVPVVTSEDAYLGGGGACAVSGGHGVSLAGAGFFALGLALALGRRWGAGGRRFVCKPRVWQ
ncbi:M4 family metallopeptidase [Polyangium aurulentum]|uniref:M4 family metallopeptidase n=1 Tax=Polyangium aurulentum TaxID=2567896 RepID=UPI0010AE6B7B|nr:M4 family metallopeptidase [Polyangium aurulentum]UQA62024.1 hypothetical protein E8A73_016730 [Polyangium aurulentum]